MSTASTAGSSTASSALAYLATEEKSRFQAWPPRFPWMPVKSPERHLGSRLGPPGQPERVVHVQRHLALGNEHAAADRDYVPPPVRCHAGTLAALQPASKPQKPRTVGNRSAAS